MHIWVLTKQARLKNYQAIRFTEEAKWLNIKLQHVCAEDFKIIEPSNSKHSIYYKNKPTPIPDVLITRITGIDYFSSALIQILENMGVAILNNAKSIENAENKLKTIQLLTSKKLPIPQSIVMKPPLDSEFISKKIGYPVILKTLYGAKGEGVILIKNSTQLIDITTLLHKSAKEEVPVIFQKYISKSCGRDIRVFTVGNKAIGAVMRMGKKGQFKANVSLGGKAQYFPLEKELSDLAIQAANALKLDIAGVDFLLNGNQFLIGEVNSSPSFEGFEKDAQINVPRHILQHAIKIKS